MSASYNARAYREYFENDFTYLNGFRRNLGRYGNRVAITDPDTGTRLTYAELGERVDRVATGLADAGVQAGDVVAYQLFNSVEFAELYLATQAVGAVGSPINFRLASGETSFILDKSAPTVFVYDTELTPMVTEALERSAHTPKVIVAVGPAIRSPFPAPPLCGTGTWRPIGSRSRRCTGRCGTRPLASTPRAPPVCRRVCRSTA